MKSGLCMFSDQGRSGSPAYYLIRPLWQPSSLVRSSPTECQRGGMMMCLSDASVFTSWLCCFSPLHQCQLFAHLLRTRLPSQLDSQTVNPLFTCTKPSKNISDFVSVVLSYCQLVEHTVKIMARLCNLGNVLSCWNKNKCSNGKFYFNSC